jgi:hypothetical protein
LAAGGPEQIEQETDGGGFARAIEPEEAKDLAWVNVQVEIIQGDERPLSFGKAANRNGRRGRAIGTGVRKLARHKGNGFLRLHRHWRGCLICLQRVVVRHG